MSPAGKGFRWLREVALTGDFVMATLNRLLVSRKQLRELGVPISYAHIDRLESRGRFPRRIKLGSYRGSRVVWRYEDVIAWVEKCAAETEPLQDDDVS
jgi:predicted DNA-binding transcriptional regulator AlpA